MWGWAPWSSGQGRGEEKGEDWEKVEHEDLEKLQVVFPLLLLSTSVIHTLLMG